MVFPFGGSGRRIKKKTGFLANNDYIAKKAKIFYISFGLVSEARLRPLPLGTKEFGRENG